MVPHTVRAVQDRALLQLYDEKGIRAGLGRGSTSLPDATETHYPESSRRLVGPDGKVVWSGP